MDPDVINMDMDVAAAYSFSEKKKTAQPEMNTSMAFHVQRERERERGDILCVVFARVRHALCCTHATLLLFGHRLIASPWTLGS